jgi:hypothetical protein
VKVLTTLAALLLFFAALFNILLFSYVTRNIWGP